jgi:predicted O-methyltransferase YrrM
MIKTESWQVQALRVYLRVAMFGQLHGLSEETRATLQRVIDNRPDAKEAEALGKVVQVRSRMQNSLREIAIEDYGTGSGNSRRRTVGSVHRSSAVPHWWGVFLFRLVRELKPKRVLELGANLGVSGAYIQSALCLNGGFTHFTTIEGDPTLASIARESLDSVGKGSSEVVVGRFQDVLPSVLKQKESIDLVFIDGHHEYKPTLEYFDRIKPFLSAKGTVVFDDVYFWSRPVRKAWKEIVRKHPTATAIDLAKFGILFCDGFLQPT